MTQHPLRTSAVAILAIGLLLGAAPAGPDFLHADQGVRPGGLRSPGPRQASAQTALQSSIAFSSTRDNDAAHDSLAFLDIYLMLMKADGTPDATSPPQRLTYTQEDGEALASLSPDGKKVVFDSNRLRADGPLNTSD